MTLVRPTALRASYGGHLPFSTFAQRVADRRCAKGEDSLTASLRDALASWLLSRGTLSVTHP
ncbi:MAG: hypothetical protein V7L25_34570 [Nostoc sp.]